MKTIQVIGASLLVGFLGGVIADDWLTSEMLRDNLLPGYTCTRTMPPAQAPLQVP